MARAKTAVILTKIAFGTRPGVSLRIRSRRVHETTLLRTYSRFCADARTRHTSGSIFANRYDASTKRPFSALTVILSTLVALRIFPGLVSNLLVQSSIQGDLPFAPILVSSWWQRSRERKKVYPTSLPVDSSVDILGAALW